MDNEDLQQELNKLGESISRLSSPNLDIQRKKMLKQSVFSKLENPSKEYMPMSLMAIVSYIKRIVEKTVIDSNKKVLIKERIIAKAENLQQRSFFWSNLFIFNKKLLSSAVVLALFFGMFSFVGIDTNIARAETFSSIDSFIGDVSCERNGKIVDVYKGMYVYENDKILTGKDSSVVIRYFDDSVSRLASNTKLILNKLKKTKDSIVNSYVEVALVSGEVWAKVINLVGDNAAFVVRANDVYAETQKAAFNVKVVNDQVEVKVFNRSVDVKKGERSDKVISGQKALVSNKILVRNISKEEKSKDWVTENLQKDKEYLLDTEKRLLVAKMKNMGINSKEDVKLNNSLSEDISVFLSLSDLEKQKKEFELAEKNFIAAQVKLTDPTLTDADKASISEAMKSFSGQVDRFYNTIKEVKYTDPKYAEELKQYVDNHVLVHKKDLSFVLPDSPVYQAREVLDEAVLAGVDSQSELAKEKIEQLSDKVAAAEEVRNIGDAEAAKTVIDDSKQEMKDVQNLVEAISDESDVDVDELKGDVDELKNYISNVSEETDIQVEKDIMSREDILNMAFDEDKKDDLDNEKLPEEKYGVTVTDDKQLPPGLDN